MSRSPALSLALTLCVSFSVALAACGTNDGKPGASGAAGSSASGAAGSGVAGTGTQGTAGTGSAGSGTAGTDTAGTAGPGIAGSTGAAGVTGTAGASGAGTAGAGTAGVTGAAGAAGAAGAGVGSKTGVQTNPGTEGDGIVAQPPPYPLHAESTMQVNGAPKGQVLGPTVYTQKGTYTGWSMWKFSYWVYVPVQYKPGHAAAIMIVNDGLKYIGDPTASAFRFNTPTVFDNLINEGSMPVTIGVFIGPGSNDGHYVTGGDGGRSRQYDTANDQYGKFLLEEFIPSEITSKYDIVTDADGWAITGHSSGGNASISAAWFYPDRIHKVLTASATMSLTGGKFPGEFLKVTPPKPLRIYHMSGSRDEPGAWGPNNDLAKDLMMMGYHFRYRPGEDVHSPPAAAASDFPDALRWLWRNYKAGL